MFLLRSAGYCLVMCVRSEGGKGEIEGSLDLNATISYLLVLNSVSNYQVNCSI